MFRKFTLVVAAALVVIGVASAASNPWEQQFDESMANLQAGRYAASSQIIDRAISEMVERLGTGQSESQLLATALTHKALASAGQGNVDDALWYWAVAQQISPAVLKTDLSPFGAAGEYLSRHPVTDIDTDGSSSVKVVKQVMPKFPAGASRFGIEGNLIVQVTVDPNGQPKFPKIVHPLPAPTLSFVALEALHHWRFEPAKKNGEPVPGVFNLTVRYKL